MAQSIQIVPKFSFPYVETVVNDYTEVANTEVAATTDNSVKQAYVVTSSKGIDNTWVSKTSRKSAESTFGESNFKKFGQPLMQALHVLDQDNSQVWFMRVMPEHATFANNIVSAYYKADTSEDVNDAHLRKFRVKLCSKTLENMYDANTFKSNIGLYENGTNKVYKDAENYTQVPILGVRCSGRGKCGNTYSLRISSAYTYEKEYGIKMYNFEVLNSETGLVKESNYVGGLVSSAKYSSETTTLINDILADTEKGLAPIDVYALEDNVETIYDAYIEWVTALHTDLEAEYKTKATQYAIPEDQMNGTVTVAPENQEHYDELVEIERMIEATLESELPSLDEFDVIRGLKVASSTDMYPGMFYPAKLTADVDTVDPGYKEADYTNSDIVDFSSVSGLKLFNGSDGEFDSPRKVHDDETGEDIQWTRDDEITYCMEKAFECYYDKKILSPRRINLTVLWDANYPFSVKQKLVDLALTRNDCRVYLDCGIINSVSSSEFKTIVTKYSIFTDKLISTDIQHYTTRETNTNKSVEVTISYFLAAQFVNHITEEGIQIPFVKSNCQLTGHVKDSLYPVIEEFDTEFKEKLYDNRFNYFECVGENVFQRAVQNTRQVANTDLLEESNVLILYRLKREIEDDIQDELYNFADEGIRQAFVEFEKAKYTDWIGTILESFDISFATSKYEFERSILHAYIEIVFRGLTKKAIVEIDINKRTYSSTTADETEE